MAGEELERAKRVYETLCTTLDKYKLTYQRDDEELKIECTARGDDLPMELSITVDVDRQLVLLLSRLPFTISEGKRLDVAIATSIVNNGMVDGSFDFDITKGNMFFRMTNSFMESEIGVDVFGYMLAVSWHTIDDYNDKFLMLDKGLISVQDFIRKEE